MSAAQMRPPWRWMISLQVASPMPLPGYCDMVTGARPTRRCAGPRRPPRIAGNALAGRRTAYPQRAHFSHFGHHGPRYFGSMPMPLSATAITQEFPSGRAWTWIRGRPCNISGRCPRSSRIAAPVASGQPVGLATRPRHLRPALLDGGVIVGAGRFDAAPRTASAPAPLP